MTGTDDLSEDTLPVREEIVLSWFRQHQRAGVPRPAAEIDRPEQTRPSRDR